MPVHIKILLIKFKRFRLSYRFRIIQWDWHFFLFSNSDFFFLCLIFIFGILFPYRLQHTNLSNVIWTHSPCVCRYSRFIDVILRAINTKWIWQIANRPQHIQQQSWLLAIECYNCRCLFVHLGAFFFCYCIRYSISYIGLWLRSTAFFSIANALSSFKKKILLYPPPLQDEWNYYNEAIWNRKSYWWQEMYLVSGSHTRPWWQWW